MEEYPTVEQAPKTPKELQLSDEEFAFLDGLDEQTEEGAAARDAWMDSRGLTYGDDIRVKVEGQSDRIFTTNADDFLTRKVDRALYEPSAAAARIFESTSDTSVESEHNSEQLRTEVSEDLGEEAVEQVVAEPEDDNAHIEGTLAHEQVTASVHAAEYQFALKESFTREELYTMGNRELADLEEQSGALSGVINALAMVPELTQRLQNRLHDYEESLSQMDGRSMDDYNPHVALARHIDAIKDDILTIQRPLKLAGLETIPDIHRAQMRLVEKVNESLAEVESNNENFQSVMAEINAHSQENVDTSRSDSGLHDDLKTIEEPLLEITSIKNDLDTQVSERSRDADIVVRGLSDIYDASVRGNTFDPALIEEVLSGLNSLGGDEVLSTLRRSQGLLSGAVDDLKLRVQSLNP